jgi:hypothetical protein
MHFAGRLRDDGTTSITDFTIGEILASFSLPAPSNALADDHWNATTFTFTLNGQELVTAT